LRRGNIRSASWSTTTLSALEESTVEDLEFGFADTPAVVARLARRAESLVVLHEADRMFPRLQ